jgi:hypothetical protein
VSAAERERIREAVENGTMTPEQAVAAWPGNKNMAKKALSAANKATKARTR